MCNLERDPIGRPSAAQEEYRFALHDLQPEQEHQSFSHGLKSTDPSVASVPHPPDVDLTSC